MICSAATPFDSTSVLRDTSYPSDGASSRVGTSSATATLANAAKDAAGSAGLVNQSTAQCCHCGYRNSHANNCPFKG
ncbi:hypothetical protein ACEPAH_1265 [Sanghuangporus vaninii]